MEIVKKTAEYKIVKKRSGRYGVLSADKKKWIGGEEKVKILAGAKLIKVMTSKKPKEAPAPAAEAAAPTETPKAE